LPRRSESGSPGRWLAAEKVPGLAIFFKVSTISLFGPLRVEADVDVMDDFVDGNDIPGIVRSDVGGDEVDFVAAIADVAANAFASDGHAVSPASGGESGLHLNAKQAAPLFDHEVIGFAVTDAAPRRRSFEGH